MAQFLLDAAGASQYSVKKQHALVRRVGLMVPLEIAAIRQPAGEFHCTRVVYFAQLL